MTSQQKINVQLVLNDWARECIRGGFLPCFMIGMREDGDGHEIKIWWGGLYTNKQVKEFLKVVVDSLPDE